MSSETPQRYVPETRIWEKKDWLYEQYWGEMKSSIEIAEKTGVSYERILTKMDEHGIPRRPETWDTGDEEYNPRHDWGYASEHTDDQPGTDDGQLADWSEYHG